MRPLPILLLFCILLAACAGGPATVEPPDPLRVARTPALQPLNPALKTCAAEAGVQLAIHDRLPQQFVDSDADLFIHWGERADLPVYVYPLAEESLVVVLSRDNPVRRLTAAEAQAIFTGRARNWTEFGGDDLAIQPWALADGSDAQKVFEDFLVGNGLLAAETQLAATLARILAEVAADPAAIAAIPSAWVTPDVRAISLEHSQPILVFLEEEPTGDAAALLTCLQGETGQGILGETYP